MSYYGWKPYVSVAARQASAAKALATAQKAGRAFAPIAAYRGAVAKTFWGKAWCDNLELYSDYANRLPRGRTYVRNGSVIDLQISQGAVKAQVMGSSLYQVKVTITQVDATRWKAIGTSCAGSIDSLVELLQGKLSHAVMQTMCAPRTGLFPAPAEITFNCSCPDWAGMCKHVAAALYGVGARLDQEPELIFSLRGVAATDLVQQAGKGLPKQGAGKRSAKVLDDAALADVFGLEMDEAPAPKKPVAVKKTQGAAAKKTAVKKPVPGKAVAKKTPAKKIPAKKVPAKKVPAKKATFPVMAKAWPFSGR